jgi:hypothetical protein
MVMEQDVGESFLFSKVISHCAAPPQPADAPSIRKSAPIADSRATTREMHHKAVIFMA